MAEMLERVKVWYSPQDCGDGSVYIKWFLTKERAEYDQENMDPTWGEDCSGSVETFVGSDIYRDAKRNEDYND
jgi:hypothetical protein